MLCRAEIEKPCHPGKHEALVRDVGDTQHDDAGALQVGAEAALEPGLVRRLHDEDQVGPREHLGIDRHVGVGGQAGGGGLHARPVGEDALRRGRAEAVAGAEEEEVGQGTTAAAGSSLSGVTMFSPLFRQCWMRAAIMASPVIR